MRTSGGGNGTPNNLTEADRNRPASPPAGQLSIRSPNSDSEISAIGANT